MNRFNSAYVYYDAANVTGTEARKIQLVAREPSTGHVVDVVTVGFTLSASKKVKSIVVTKGSSADEAFAMTISDSSSTAGSTGILNLSTPETLTSGAPFAPGSFLVRGFASAENVANKAQLWIAGHSADKYLKCLRLGGGTTGYDLTKLRGMSIKLYANDATDFGGTVSAIFSSDATITSASAHTQKRCHGSSLRVFQRPEGERQYQRELHFPHI